MAPCLPNRGVVRVVPFCSGDHSTAEAVRREVPAWMPQPAHVPLDDDRDRLRAPRTIAQMPVTVDGSKRGAARDTSGDQALAVRSNWTRQLMASVDNFNAPSLRLLVQLLRVHLFERR